MPSYLDSLVDSTRARVARAKDEVPEEELRRRAHEAAEPRDFRAALERDGFSIVAEIKRASPTRGDLNRDLDAGAAARVFADAGAAALSVLTEPDHFAGSLEDLRAATRSGVPVLRKDFIVDPWQIPESRAAGADAVLLIVRALRDSELASLLAATRAHGMDALVEVHDADELERALAVGAGLIGVNHRDLETFEIHPGRTAELADRVPSRCVLVALSGVSSRREVEELEAAGARAALVGESLVTAPDPGAKLRELLGAP
jgi:indole-3-glycerol phosphate synthase